MYLVENLKINIGLKVMTLFTQPNLIYPFNENLPTKLLIDFIIDQSRVPLNPPTVAASENTDDDESPISRTIFSVPPIRTWNEFSP